MDLSGSMRALIPGEPLPGGEPPRPTRFDAMQAAVLDLLERDTETRIGIVVFGVQAYVLSPPTHDRASSKKLVRALEVGAIDPGGSAIGDALDIALAQTEKVSERDRSILLFADSEANGDGARPEAAATKVAAAHVPVFAVHVSDGGETEIVEGVDFEGKPILRKETFPAKPEELEQVARATGGRFVLAPSVSEVIAATRDLLPTDP